MLILSRRIGERLVIDDKITVTVIEVRGGQIRLGIEAPKAIPVWREEVVAKKESVMA
ncbi:MAG: carbon storage regulator CsrA [Thermoguttaceae bacterium]|jgi:carbon storage regulator